MESEISGIFPVKVVAKNKVLGSLGTQRQACFCSVMSLFEEAYKFLELNCYT